ncbi:DNA primase [Alkalihalobacillus sp. NPDC078783]
MSELLLIKKRLYEEERIEELLEKLDCWGYDTEQGGNLIVCALPDGDNKRSIQIKNNEYLSTAVRSRGIQGDIFDLVAYILYEAETKEERLSNLNKSKFWICKEFNYYEYIDEFYRVTSNDAPARINKETQWLKSFKKKNTQQLKNEILPVSALSRYDIAPHIKWLEEGLTIETQKRFGVGFDVRSERIIFPIHDSEGNLIGVKGRYVGTNEKTLKDVKYIYLQPCNKSLELFNFHRAYKYIKEKNEIIVVEGGKSTMFLDQWGIRNSVSVEGDQLTYSQIELIKSLGFGVKLVFAWDKDKDVAFIKEQLKPFKNRQVEIIFDKGNLLTGEKDSPVDRGKEVFRKLYSDYKFKM